MRALAARELIAATRTPVVPLGALTILTVSAAFVLIWTAGLPVATPMNLYDQSRALHWAMLAIVLPYVAIRCAPQDRTEDVGLMAALVRIGTTRAVAGKVAGSLLLQCVLILTGLPALILAQQAAAVPLADVAVDMLPLLGLALLVASLSVAAMLFAADELRAWISSSAIVLVVLSIAASLAPDAPRVGVSCALAGALVTAGLCSAVGRRLRVQERPDGR